MSETEKMTDTYRDQVTTALAARGGRTELNLHEKALIEMGRFYRVGPVDCAYQIMSDRADMLDQRMGSKRSRA